MNFSQLSFKTELRYAANRVFSLRAAFFRTFATRYDELVATILPGA
jgi:hypothetical protein